MPKPGQFRASICPSFKIDASFAKKHQIGSPRFWRAYFVKICRAASLDPATEQLNGLIGESLYPIPLKMVVLCWFGAGFRSSSGMTKFGHFCPDK
jgi:hypothetical protein